MAWFNSYSFSTGSIADLTSPALSFTLTASGEYRVSFWMYRGDNFGFFYDQLNVYVSTTTSSAAGTLLGTVNLDISQSPAVSSEGWYQYTFTVPASYSGATNYIIFEGYSDFGYDILVEDVSVDYYANCTGAPTAGSSVVTPGSGGVGTSFTLSLSGATSGAGITYQWQSGPSATGPWTNISGATTATYTFLGISANTYFQCVETCTPTSTSSTSTDVLATYVPTPPCTPTAASWVIESGDVTYGINSFNITGYLGSTLSTSVDRFQ